MSEKYIEQSAVIEAIKNFGKGAIDNGKYSLDTVDDILLLVKVIEEIPCDDVEKVKHGYWKPDIEYEDSGICSVCFSTGGKEEPYCSYCGAKMDGVQNE